MSHHPVAGAFGMQTKGKIALDVRYPSVQDPDRSDLRAKQPRSNELLGNLARNESHTKFMPIYCSI